MRARSCSTILSTSKIFVLLFLVNKSRALLWHRLTRKILYFPKKLQWTLIFSSHWVFLTSIFEFMLFRKPAVEILFPKVVKFVARVDENLLSDQTTPCASSHEGESCLEHSARLYAVWWRKIFPTVLATRAAWSLIGFALGHAPKSSTTLSGRIGSIVCGHLFNSLRLCAFLFASSGLPGGIVFCATKRMNVPSRRGTRLGMLFCSFVGALSIFLLERRRAARFTNSAWASSFVFAFAAYAKARVVGS